MTGRSEGPSPAARSKRLENVRATQMSLHFSPIASATPAFRHNRQVFHRARAASPENFRVCHAPRNAGGGRVMERKAEHHVTFVGVL